jgi:hypothetical protein
MKSFRCIRCNGTPAGLKAGFFAVEDGRGRTWVCREDDAILGSGWEGWAHYGGIAAGYANATGESISSDNVFEDVARVMADTFVVVVDDSSALTQALAMRET